LLGTPLQHTKKCSTRITGSEAKSCCRIRIINVTCAQGVDLTAVASTDKSTATHSHSFEVVHSSAGNPFGCLLFKFGDASNQGAEWPLIVYLHGAGESGSTDKPEGILQKGATGGCYRP
jgi:predicted peptidase